MQGYIRKITRLVSLLLKDKTAPRELVKSVLRYIKIAITFLSFDTKETAKELC